MPLYEYECLECKERFERRQSVNDEPIRMCVKCGAAARRVFHPVGIIFKGSGFYATDNRKPHYGESAKSSEKPKGEGEEASSAKASSGGEETNAGKEESKAKTGKEESKATAGSAAAS